MSETSPIGKAMWLDQTVPDALALRDFYAAVIGWTFEPVPVEDHEDFVMKSPAGEAVAGICHRKGPNAAIPGGWIPYFIVESLEAALNEALARGATHVTGGVDSGYIVLLDPTQTPFALALAPAEEA